MKLCTPPSVPKSWLPSIAGVSQFGMGKEIPFPATTPSRYQFPAAFASRLIGQVGELPAQKGAEKELISFQLPERNINASAITEAATLGSFHPPPAELAL